MKKYHHRLTFQWAVSSTAGFAVRAHDPALSGRVYRAPGQAQRLRGKACIAQRQFMVYFFFESAQAPSCAAQRHE